MNMRLVIREEGCALCGADGTEPCSPQCATQRWPPAPASPKEWAIRILAGLGLALAATGMCVKPGLLGLGLSMSAIVACLFCAVLQLLTKVKVEPAGKVTSKGCCGYEGQR